MTDKEIINVLSLCQLEDSAVCETCPLAEQYPWCDEILQKETFDLINRQKAEIERLNNCVKSEDEIRAIMKSQMTPMVKVIVNEQIDIAVKLAKAEAIKEFAERLKLMAPSICWDTRTEYFFSIKNIDNLVKEMVGDNNG